MLCAHGYNSACCEACLATEEEYNRQQQELYMQGAKDLAKRLKAKAVKNADTRDPAMLPYVTDDDIDAVLKEMEKEGRPLRDSRA